MSHSATHLHQHSHGPRLGPMRLAFFGSGILGAHQALLEVQQLSLGVRRCAAAIQALQDGPHSSRVSVHLSHLR